MDTTKRDDPRLVARWESRGGAHVVELWKPEGAGYSYRATGGGGSCGIVGTDADAIAYMERDMGWGDGTRAVDLHQPDANTTPMRRTYGATS